MNLKQLGSLIEVGIKNFLREPTASMLPIIAATMFWIFATGFGGEDPGRIGLMVPAFIALSITMVGIMDIPYTIIEYKATKVFKRLRATPLEPAYILISQAVVSFLIVLASTLALTGVAVIAFDVELHLDILSFLLAFGLSSITFFSLGFVLCAVLRTSRAVESVTGILLYPLFLLSGIIIPLQPFPQFIQDAAEFNPVVHSEDILTATWLGNDLGDYTRAIIILCVITVICTFVAIKTFRWE